MNLQQIEDLLNVNPLVAQIILFLILFIVAMIIFVIFKKILLKIIFFLIRKTKTKWDDALIERKVLHKLFFLIPLLFLYLSAYLLPDIHVLIQKIVISLIIWFSLISISAFLNALNDIYLSFPKSANKPIKGYLQIVSIFFFIMGIIVIISNLIGKSPLILISGLGAMTAVLLLIFKDTILSFVASLQISFNDLIKIGDWLEVPQFNADGDVIDVALHTVKIQNWDKTITTIPTHQLINGSFKNWRGMQESGGRRIKRAVNIDISTIKFCDENMLQKFEKFEYLQNYLNHKKDEIASYNKKNNIDESELINGRRLTNIGCFRAYVVEYLKHNPKINNDMTFLIRQLPPSAQGLPIEIYVFTNDTVWANYEAIQADIFDHILSAVQEFELRVFQNPSGYDFCKLQTGN